MVITRSEILKALSRYRQMRREQYGIQRIGVFGSAARDHLTADSDIDIVVELAEPDLLTLVGIKQELEELFGRPVDIVRYRNTMNAFLKRRIEQDAVYVS